MSQEVVCDRCGKTSKDLQGYGHLANVRAIKYRGIQSLEAREEYLLNVDLCVDCLDKIKSFIFKEVRKNDN